MMEQKKTMSKGKRNGLIACGIVVALIIAVLIYGFVITKSGYWLISKLTPDSEAVKMTYTSASDTTKAIADEGFVLMYNEDNLLPFDTSAEKQRINLFGMRSVQLVYNASGSTATDVSNCLTLVEALNSEAGGFEVNQELLYLYYNYYKSGKASLAQAPAPKNVTDSEFIETLTNVIMPEVPAKVLEDSVLYNDGRSVLEHAHEYSDVALITLGRGGGEMFDFEPEQLRLVSEEKALMDAVCAEFDKVIVVINSANAMELDFIEDYPSIKSVIWIGYPGESGIQSLAEILNGTVNPSGRTVDTWLRDNLANPAAANYLPLASGGTWDKDDAFHYVNAPDENGYFVQYSEGIYMGYRYFESRHDTDSSYNYNADVMFPFGHGLSYTTFEKIIMAMNEENGEITVRVEVKNTGSVAGKDTIQIYYNPPYTGAIEKSTVNLVTFTKTNLIAPGDTEVYSLTFNVEDMASYDYANHGCYVLEKGDYEIMLRENAHVLLDSEIYNVGSDILYNDANGGRSTDGQTATNQFADAAGNGDYLTRAWNPNSRAFTGPQAEDYTASNAVLDAIAGPAIPTDAELGLTGADMPVVGVKLDQIIMLKDMVDVPYDDAKWDEFISQLTVEEMAKISGNGAWHIEEIDRLGVPRSRTPDGTTAIGSSTYSGAVMGLDGSGVTYPTPVVIASTWNADIARMMGESIAVEGKAIGYNGWYAPAMNTHRTAFNGRNFEYYSEDGVLAGVMAGNVIDAVTDSGFVVFMKHFALNDRETNCRSYLFTWSNEQAIREIYLKPFEYAVKVGGSNGAMSSFNFIGTTWAGGHNGLLNEVLRNEWGMEGIVVTDAALYPFMSPAEASYNGGNLQLDVMAAWNPAGDTAESALKAAAQNSATQIGMTRNLQQNAKDILFAVSRTWYVTEG